VRRVLLSPRWLALHLLAVVLVAVCLRLGWWQWERAGQGNARSLGYALEWPGFAAFVLLMWGYLVRDALRASRERERPADATTPDSRASGTSDDAESALLPTDAALAAARAQAEDQDDELTAYNDYLARLNARVKAAESRRNLS
jgi:DNA-binding transcriptional regulator of glucitol operon